MKIVLHALLAAITIHGIYFLTTVAVGYVKTVLYRPNMVEAWENVETLQSEAAFGSTVSPGFHVVTFLSVAFLCWVLLFACKKMSGGTKRQEVK